MDTDPLIAQAQAALQAELTQLAQLTPVTMLAVDATPQQQAVQLARLQAAHAALRLAAALLRADDPAAAQVLDAELRQLDRQVKAWRRKGQGWFETRTVTRTKIRLEQNAADQVTHVPVTVAYGPYRYFRWRDADGKTRTHYLGRQPEDAAGPAPVIPAPPPTDRLWATSGNPDHNTPPVDAPAPPLSVPPRRQPPLDDDTDQVGRLLTDLTHALGRYQHRTQISREKADSVMDQMGDVLDQHERAVMRQAICVELHRQHWRGVPPDANIGVARIQAVMAMVARDATAEELSQAVSDVGWELNDHRTLRSWRHEAFVRMLRASRTALARAHAQARAAWRRVVDLGIDPTPQIDAGLAELQAIHAQRQPTLVWEATPRQPPLSVVPGADDPTGRHLTENGQTTLCWRAVPEGAIHDHAIGPYGCTACVDRALAQGHRCPCCGRLLTIPVLPDGLCLDCAMTEAGQRFRAAEAARQERVAALRGQRRKKRAPGDDDAPPPPPHYALSDESEIPPIPPPAAIVPDPGARAAALVLTIAATTRHLTADGDRTLCGRAIDPDGAVRQATFYSYADCAACARVAQAQQRTCPACRQPLMQVDDAGHCQVCATQQAQGGDRLAAAPVRQGRLQPLPLLSLARHGCTTL